MTTTERELEQMLKLIGELPELQRQVITLRKVYGLGVMEIAFRLHISEARVEEEMMRAVKYVLEKLP
jgi:DNA-directed RNA polymerase specialized sigma24 family protein